MDELLILSVEPQGALRRGKSVDVAEKATQMACVVVRNDVFQRMKTLLRDFDPREAYPALDDVMRED